MSRLFTFGCSFTGWEWWTWADIVAGTRNWYDSPDGNYDYWENFAVPGAGNQLIFNKLIHAITEHNICDTDTVMIMWTNVSREDRFINGNWKTEGNVFTNGFYDDEFIKKYVDIIGYYERDIPTMHAAQMLLDHIGCKNKIMSMVDVVNYGQYDNFDYSDKIKHLTDKFSDSLQRILPSVHDVVFNYDYSSRPLPDIDRTADIRSCHPTPAEHLEYVEKVLPEFEITRHVRQSVLTENERVLTGLRDAHIIYGGTEHR